MDERFVRHMPLFGMEGQKKIRATRVAIVGVGGIGSHVVQQLALLGVREFGLIEPEDLEESNRNRFIGARHDDAVPGTPKLYIAERLIRSIEPEAAMDRVPHRLVSHEAVETVRSADVVIGCLDKEGPRLILTELCAAYERKYIDIASDVIPGEPPEWGGRVCISWDGPGCVVCLDVLDTAEARLQVAGPQADRERREIYGIEEDALAGGGPAVVSVNGVMASLAVTEFMAGVTGLRKPVPLLTYRGWRGIVSVRPEPRPNCYYCESVRGKGAAADVERYIRDGVGAYL